MARTLGFPAGLPHPAPRASGASIARLDFTRIAAEAGAIAINAGALLLLLAPLHPGIAPIAKRPDDLIVIPVAPPKPPPPPVRTVEVTRPRTPSVAPSFTPPKIQVQPPIARDSLSGDIAVDPLPIADAGASVGDQVTEPLQGAHLEYEIAPPPSYPPQAVRDGLTGTVILRVLVGIDGRPIDVQIERSSGHRALDAAARRQVLKKWRFKPAMYEGQTTQAVGLVPVDFSLTR